MERKKKKKLEDRVEEVESNLNHVAEENAKLKDKLKELLMENQ